MFNRSESIPPLNIFEQIMAQNGLNFWDFFKCKNNTLYILTFFSLAFSLTKALHLTPKTLTNWKKYYICSTSNLILCMHNTWFLHFLSNFWIVLHNFCLRLLLGFLSSPDVERYSSLKLVRYILHCKKFFYIILQKSTFLKHP